MEAELQNTIRIMKNMMFIVESAPADTINQKKMVVEAHTFITSNIAELERRIEALKNPPGQQGGTSEAPF